MHEDRLAALEDEVKVLNNEIKQVLLDIREQVISRFQNPLPDFDIGPLEKEMLQHRANSGASVADPIDLSADQPILKPWQPERPEPAAGGPVPVVLNALGAAPGPGPAAPGAVAPAAAGPWEPPRAQAPGNISSQPGPTTEVRPEVVARAEPEDDDSPATKTSEGEEMETFTDIMQPRKNGRHAAKVKAACAEDRRDDSSGERPDLLTVATLSRWLTNGMKQVGRERMEAVIDIYEAMGGLSPDLKEILLRLLRIHDGEGAPLSKTMAVLLELDNLQTRGRMDKTEAAILSLFLNGNGRKEASHR